MAIRNLCSNRAGTSRWFRNSPKVDCREFASAVKSPSSPREFVFVKNCVDYRAEAERPSIVLWPYMATPAEIR